MLIVVLLKGPPGSGKSTLARKLSQHLQWPHIDKDDVRDCFQPVAFKHPSVDWNELSYDVMFSVLEAQLRVGVSCIVDCPLARICLFSRAEYLTAKYGAKIVLVECIVKDNTEWASRLKARGLQDEGTNRSHKPANIDQALEILHRNRGSEHWTGEVSLLCHLSFDMMATTADQVSEEVILALQKLISHKD